MPSPDHSYPFFNATWTLHSLSPLYHSGPPLTNPQTLSTFSQRLKQALSGDSLRSFQVALTDSDGGGLFAATGQLKECKWELLGDEESWEQEHADDERAATASSEEPTFGISISIIYEKVVRNALLLQDPTQSPSVPLPAGFSSYPLFLTHMPNTLRLTCLDFLASAFGTHISPLKVSSGLIVTALEDYVLALSEGSAASRLVRDVLKDIHMTFAFTAAPGLKSLDITISREDVARLLPYGASIVAAAAAAEMPSRSPPSEPRKTPFMTALSRYIETHMAMQLLHSDIRLVKLSCGAFVLGGSTAGEGGKLKLLASSQGHDDEADVRDAVKRANDGLIGTLARWAS